MPLEEPMVVAKYIDNPLLINGHKSDLRQNIHITRIIAKNSNEKKIIFWFQFISTLKQDLRRGLSFTRIRMQIQQIVYIRYNYVTYNFFSLPW